jgi:hypothetical protein
MTTEFEGARSQSAPQSHTGEPHLTERVHSFMLLLTREWDVVSETAEFGLAT